MKIINDLIKFFSFFLFCHYQFCWTIVSLLNILILVLVFMCFFTKPLQNFKGIYLYLILNSILSINHQISLTRNVGFIRLFTFYSN